MKHLLLAALCALPFSVQADPCADRIRALFDGGPLDPRDRPPHRHTNTVTAEDGSLIRIFDSVMESGINSMPSVRGSGQFTLVLDRNSWTGPTADGPWTKHDNLLPEDRMGQIDRIRLAEQANMTDADCPGQRDLDGKPVEVVIYNTKSDPDPAMGGAWFGAHNTVFYAPASGRVLRWEMTDFQNSWSTSISKERHVITHTYDDSIRLPRPN